jgi:pimeloyl-ACP methyl ester carboxylesterase
MSVLSETQHCACLAISGFILTTIFSLSAFRFALAFFAFRTVWLKQVLIHGRADENVPISQSERFVERAKVAGDETSLVTLEGIGHFELIDPESPAWDAVAHSTLTTLGVEA